MRAWEQAYFATRGRLLTERSPLADPTFVANFEGLSSLRPGFSGFGERVIGIEQPLEIPFKRLARNDIASKEERVAEMDFELAKLDKVAEIRKAYGEVPTVRREQELARDDYELAQDFLRMAQLRYEAGDVPPPRSAAGAHRGRQRRAGHAGSREERPRG